MTLLEIDFVLHVYTTPTNYRDGDYSAPAVRETIDRFLKEGVIRPHEKRPDIDASAKYDRYFEITERGEAYVAMLKSVPLPICKWVMPSKDD